MNGDKDRREKKKHGKKLKMNCFDERFIGYEMDILLTTGKETITVSGKMVDISQYEIILQTDEGFKVVSKAYMVMVDIKPRRQ